MTNREQIREMIKSIGQNFYEDALTIEIENLDYGENITFKFDKEGKLTCIFT